MTREKTLTCFYSGELFAFNADGADVAGVAENCTYIHVIMEADSAR